jgi:hypothetical protein
MKLALKFVRFGQTLYNTSMDILALLTETLNSLELPRKKFSSKKEGTALITRTLVQFCSHHNLEYKAELKLGGFWRANKYYRGFVDFLIHYNDHIYAIEIDSTNKGRSLAKLQYLAEEKQCTAIWVKWNSGIHIEVPQSIHIIDLSGKPRVLWRRLRYSRR